MALNFLNSNLLKDLNLKRSHKNEDDLDSEFDDGDEGDDDGGGVGEAGAPHGPRARGGYEVGANLRHLPQRDNDVVDQVAPGDIGIIAHVYP